MYSTPNPGSQPDEPELLIADFSELTFIDAAGLGALIAVRLRAEIKPAVRSRVGRAPDRR